jgi:hypothetical protein
VKKSHALNINDMAFQTNAFQGNDADLLARIRRFEDHFGERKTAGDKKRLAQNHRCLREFYT